MSFSIIHDMDHHTGRSYDLAFQLCMPSHFQWHMCCSWPYSGKTVRDFHPIPYSPSWTPVDVFPVKPDLIQFMLASK